ncbi:MAG: AMIN domain-containing protein [Gammaproteobacteria bacterium]|jgi:N-acetylmuramoyl-L-alanine amidase|nr:AMIN domain-containing protein [Gammaproteobacteria bacterium]
MRNSRFLIGGVLILLCTAAQAASTVENIRIWAENGKTRVVLDLSRPAAHNIFTLRGPDRLVVDLKSSRLSESLKAMPQGTGSVRSIRSAVRANGQLRVVLDLNEAVRSRSFTAGPNNKYGDRLVIDLQRTGGLHAVKTASEAYKPGRDVVVAIDPGHGGHDPGAIGRGKTREKDVALQISRTLAARINAEPGMKAVLVREGDYYVDHRRRMEIARRNKADLFISVHADAVDDRRAYGASVYALSLKGASDEAARQLAERENASVRIGGVSLEDKDEVLASVLLDLSQSAALSASMDVGSKVIRELARLGKVHRRTVQQAGFLVLKSPDMPSILVETAFISNPSEEKKLRDKRHQERLADALLAGIRTYFYTNPPPDTRIAMEMRRVPAKQVRHVIARGDTLSEIAERYNVSTAAIRAANKLSNDSIRVGQTLSIPVYAGT